MPAPAVFVVECVCQTSLGESLYVVGSHPALGEWDPSKGMRLTTNSSMYPKWASTEPVEIRSDDEEVEYKFVIRKNDGYVWEHLPQGNRKLPNVNNSAMLVVSTQFNNETCELQNSKLQGYDQSPAQ